MSEPVVVYVPRTGLSVTEVTLTVWLVDEGETVQEGEPICEVATDKVEVAIEAPASGVLTYKAAVDDVLAVGAELALIAPG